MTPQTIYCNEPLALPARVAHTLEEGAALVVYALTDDPGRGVSTRRTILRPADALAPANAQLLFEAELGQSGRFRVLRVRRAGRVPVDLFRNEGRTRVTVGTEIRSGARLEADPEDREAISFSLSFAAQANQGMRASVGGGGTRASQASAAQATLLWLVPSIIDIIRDPFNDFKDGAIEWAAEAGVNPRALTTILVTLLTLSATGGFGAVQYFAAKDAEAKLVDTQAALAESEAATQAALESEAACVVDRRSLAAAANKRDEERRLAAESALARAPARAMAEGKGGPRFAADAVVPFDADAWDKDVAAVVALLDDAAATVEGTARCRGYTAALERDLPTYLLTTHPDPAQACPTAYLAITGGTTLRGSWGLSDRALAELAGPAQVADDPGAAGFDPRDVDRAAAAMVAAGVRSVRKVLLSVDVGPRATVAPSELDLWSLALFDAANRLPPVSPGAPPQTLAGCVGELIVARAAADTAPAAGEPVLPGLAAVAAGDVVLAPAPTATCAWPEGALAAGANAAVRAAARTAAVPPPPATP